MVSYRKNNISSACLTKFLYVSAGDSSFWLQPKLWQLSFLKRFMENLFLCLLLSTYMYMKAFKFNIPLHLCAPLHNLYVLSWFSATCFLLGGSRRSLGFWTPHSFMFWELLGRKKFQSCWPYPTGSTCLSCDSFWTKESLVFVRHYFLDFLLYFCFFSSRRFTILFLVCLS